MKGEFEKRCYDYRPSLCIHAPEEDENGEITQYVHDTFRLARREEIKQAIDEARKEFPDLGAVKIVLKEHPEYLKNSPNWAWFVKWFGGAEK